MANWDRKMQIIPHTTSGIVIDGSLLEKNIDGFKVRKNYKGNYLSYYQYVCAVTNTLPFAYYTGYDEAQDYLLVNNDNNSRIQMTKSRVVTGIASLFGFDIEKYTYEELCEEIEKKIPEIENIKDEKELYKKFPELYGAVWFRMVMDNRDNEKAYNCIYSRISSPSKFREYIEHINSGRPENKKIPQFCIDADIAAFESEKDFNVFKKYYVDYLNTVLKSEEFEKTYSDLSVDCFGLKNSDFNKFYFITALSAFKMLKKETDSSKRKEFINVINAFLEKTSGFDLAIKAADDTIIELNNFRAEFGQYIMNETKPEIKDSAGINDQEMSKITANVTISTPEEQREILEQAAKEVEEEVKKQNLSPEQAKLASEILEFYTKTMVPKSMLNGIDLFEKKKSKIFIYENGMVVIDGFPMIEEQNKFRTQNIYVFPITKLLAVLKCKTDADVYKLLGKGYACNHGKVATSWESRLSNKINQNIYVNPMELQKIAEELKRFTQVDVNELKIYESRVSSLSYEDYNLTPRQRKRKEAAKRLVAESEQLCGDEMYNDDQYSVADQKALKDAEREIAETLGLKSESSSGRKRSPSSRKGSSKGKAQNKKMSFLDMCKKFEREAQDKVTFESKSSKYKRNPYVSIYTKERTKDDLGEYHCDLCDKRFYSMERLESHHIVPLKDGGVDNICNTICLCGECHDRMHMDGVTFYMRSMILDKLYLYVRERDPEFMEYLLNYFEYNPNKEIPIKKKEETRKEQLERLSEEVKEQYRQAQLYASVTDPYMYNYSLQMFDATKGGRK